MNKVKILSIVSIVLLFINIGLIVFIGMRHSGRPPQAGPRNIIIEKLNFNDSQVQAYDILIKEHRSEITKSQNEMMVLKNQLYRNLVIGNSVSITDSLIQEISKVQSKIEHIHYAHFEDIKRICNGNQVKLFENLTEEIALLFSHSPPLKK